MPKTDSTRYTFLFATAVCVVCALLVAASAVGLRDRQENNQLVYRQKNVLLAAGLVKPDQKLSDRELQAIFDKNIVVRLIDLKTGEMIPEGKIDARSYDQKKARNDPAQSRAAPPNPALVSRLPNYGAVYFVTRGVKDAPPELVVLPIEGMAMWATVYGFIAARARRQHGARAHLLRPAGDAGPGRRDRQPEVAGALAGAQGASTPTGSRSSRSSRARPARRTRIRTGSTGCPARRSPATASRGSSPSGSPRTATGPYLKQFRAGAKS